MSNDSGEKPKDGRADSTLKALESIASIIRTITWPFILLFLFYEFRAPLIEAGQKIPTLLAQASKVSAGGLTIEIQQSARAAGDPELALLISGLSRDAISLLLGFPAGGRAIMTTGWSSDDQPQPYFLPAESQVAALRELDQKGLLDAGVKIDAWYARAQGLLEPDKSASNRYDITRQILVAREGKQRLADVEEEELWAAVYELSERGRKAVTLIIESVIQELQRPKVGLGSSNERSEA